MLRARLAKRFVAVFALAALAVAFAVAISAAAFGRIQDRLVQTRAAVDASFAIRSAFGALVDEETGVRGYAAGGAPLFLEPYRAGRRAYAAYRANPPVLSERAEALALARFHRSADALQPFFQAQVAAVARGDRQAAVRNLPAEKFTFDRLRRDEAAATAALDRSLAASRAATNAALIAGRLATLLTGLVLIVSGGLVVALAGRARDNAALARRDSLTQLPNRRAFDERLEDELTTLGTASLAVLYIDLDRFKPINDRLGHAAGDKVLAICAERLRAGLRPNDFVARLGGDEFGAILCASDGAAARAVAARVAAEIAAPIAIAGTTVQLNASIGIALAPGEGRDAGEIVRAADAAMYRAKREARAGDRGVHAPSGRSATE
jgi:diguanylate cyclase (GGDEF)-like protein